MGTVGYEEKGKAEEYNKLRNQGIEIHTRAEQEQRGLTTEEMQEVENLFSRCQQLDAEIKTEQSKRRFDALKETTQVRATFPQARPVVHSSQITADETINALRGSMLRGTKHQRSEYTEAAEKCGLNIYSQKYFDVRLRTEPTWWERRMEKRGSGMSEGAVGTGFAQGGGTVGTGSTGGFLVEQSQLASYVTLYQKLYSGMRQISRVERTEIGNILYFDTIDDTGNAAENNHAENVAVAETDITVGQVSCPVQTYDSSVQPISLEQIADSKYPIIPLVSKLGGIRVARKQNTDFTTRNDTAMKGVKVAVATSGNVYTSANSGAFGYQDIIKAVYKTNLAYNLDPSYGIMCSQTALQNFWALQDANGRPLMEMNAADTDFMAQRLCLSPITVNNDLDSMASGNTVAISGAWDHSVIRDNWDLQIYVSDELLMNQLARAVILWQRSGFCVTNPTAFTNWKVAA